MSPERTRAVPHALERALSGALLAGGSLLALVACVAWALGGGVLRLGPVAISVQRPFRALAVAVSLLLLREALRRVAGARARVGFVALLAVLLAALALDSRPRLVGDGQEYVAMAWNLAQGRPPGLLRRSARRSSGPSRCARVSSARAGKPSWAATAGRISITSGCIRWSSPRRSRRWRPREDRCSSRSR